MGKIFISLSVAMLIWIGLASMSGNHPDHVELSPDQKRSQDLKDCFQFEQDIKFRTYAELSVEERKMLYYCQNMK